MIEQNKRMNMNMKMHLRSFISVVLLMSFVCTSHASSSAGSPHKSLPEIIGQVVAYRRWRTITERAIRFPGNKVVDFDLVGLNGANCGAVLIFAWDSSTKTATLVREYHPGPHAYLHGVAAGIVEEDKHSGNVELAAQHELEEECHLAGGRWFLLTPQPLAMDKYTTTKVSAFLVVDALHVPDPRPQDDEEDIEIIRGVGIPQILEMISRGEFNMVGTFACLMAMNKLRELNEIE
jgi:hypothetical protein